MSEIQRLKQEAKRFIAILSQESDDETLSPTKRQSLTREVESLQVNLLCRKALLICSGRRLSTSVFEMDQSRSHGAGQFFFKKDMCNLEEIFTSYIREIEKKSILLITLEARNVTRIPSCSVLCSSKHFYIVSNV